jgi:hypothetical protein
MTSLSLQLLGAYHDRILEFTYASVLSYSLQVPAAGRGLGDWLYDEFRLSKRGTLIHEIEWDGFPHEPGSHWLIEATDVEFTFRLK